ncbi:MAG TPA: type II secretion system major pseudopilin GspG [Steroidobacteraceae bacterium]|nr:type II secretion system major pseudopilin GspG [Steroidobacteraceae bacterium]
MRRRVFTGFTLLELMVVLLILALIASIAAPQVTKHLRKAKTETAKIQVDALGAAVDSFHVDNGRLPTTEETLKALVERPAGLATWDGPYIKKKESLIDPWGEPYRYRAPGKSGEYEVYTLGSDKKEGGEGEAGDIGTG